MEHLQQLVIAYEALLRIPDNNNWRNTNQDIYAAVRDEIASITKWSSEEIQGSFECVNYVKNLK